MSESLAVKHRPKELSEVVGQDKIVASIETVLKKNTSKAFLLSGPPGVGKTTIARLIADRLGADKNLGVYEIDGATFTGIDSMRDLANGIRYKPLSGDVQVVILDEVHALSKQAFQSLLKVLEEPPAHVYWVLCTTDLQKVPAAIKTRCAAYQLNPVPKKDMVNLLNYVSSEENFNIPKEVIDFIVEKAEGSARQAISFLSMCESCSNTSEAAEILKSEEGSETVLNFCRYIAGDRLDFHKALEFVREMKEKDQDLEGARIAVCGYLSSCIMRSRSKGDSVKFLHLLSEFSTPLDHTNKLGGFLMIIGNIMLGD